MNPPPRRSLPTLVLQIESHSTSTGIWRMSFTDKSSLLNDDETLTPFRFLSSTVI
ncbi:hypothetical protein OAM64_04465 [Candidatus Thioglobus sp.]|nr:hypothetical protein [Candidatus Thioglobus sp.]